MQDSLHTTILSPPKLASIYIHQLMMQMRKCQVWGEKMMAGMCF